MHIGGDYGDTRDSGKVKEGRTDLEEAEGALRRQPFEDLGYAKLDTHRKIRSGFPEVVFCAGKADAHLLAIFGRLYEEEGEVLGTRHPGNNMN